MELTLIKVESQDEDVDIEHDYDTSEFVRPESLKDCHESKNEENTKHCSGYFKENINLYESCDHFIEQDRPKSESAVLKHSIKENTCNICNARIKGKPYHFKKHLNTHLKKSHICSICDKNFTTKYSLLRHLNVHSPQCWFRCAVCGKLFNDKGNLSKHMRIHLGIKPYKCGECDKRFALKSSLNSHLLVHGGEKQFECFLCKNKFRKKDTLRKHVARHLVREAKLRKRMEN